MKEKEIEEVITELMGNCGFGAVVSPIASVSGGFLHKMYRVITDCGIYAVKYLNPQIMSRTGVHENYERAEKIERILEKEGIPIVPSITVNGQKMQTIEGCCFYIFNWQEGRITDWNHISIDECKKAGNILGRIHAINPENVSHQKPELSKIDWPGYVHRAYEEKSEIASLLADTFIGKGYYRSAAV